MRGGMLKRMMIEMEMISEEKLMFEDEKKKDIDIVVKIRVMEIMEKMVEEREIGIIIVKNDMGVVDRMENDVEVIDNGRIIEKEKVMDIFKKKGNEVKRMMVRENMQI